MSPNTPSILNLTPRATTKHKQKTTPRPRKRRVPKSIDLPRGMADYDKDGVPDIFDCNPFNPNEDGWWGDAFRAVRSYASSAYSSARSHYRRAQSRVRRAADAALGRAGIGTYRRSSGSSRYRSTNRPGRRSRGGSSRRRGRSGSTSPPPKPKPKPKKKVKASWLSSLASSGAAASVHIKSAMAKPILPQIMEAAHAHYKSAEQALGICPAVEERKVSAAAQADYKRAAYTALVAAHEYEEMYGKDSGKTSFTRAEAERAEIKRKEIAGLQQAANVKYTSYEAAHGAAVAAQGTPIIDVSNVTGGLFGAYGISGRIGEAGAQLAKQIDEYKLPSAHGSTAPPVMLDILKTSASHGTSFLSSLPIGAEVIARESWKRPEILPAALLVGVGGTAKAAYHDPIQTAADMVVLGGLAKGAKVGGATVMRVAPKALPKVLLDAPAGIASIRLGKLQVTGAKSYTTHVFGKPLQHYPSAKVQFGGKSVSAGGKAYRYKSPVDFAKSQYRGLKLDRVPEVMQLKTHGAGFRGSPEPSPIPAPMRVPAQVSARRVPSSDLMFGGRRAPARAKPKTDVDAVFGGAPKPIKFIRPENIIGSSLKPGRGKTAPRTPEATTPPDLVMGQRSVSYVKSQFKVSRTPRAKASEVKAAKAAALKQQQIADARAAKAAALEESIAGSPARRIAELEAHARKVDALAMRDRAAMGGTPLVDTTPMLPPGKGFKMVKKGAIRRLSQAEAAEATPLVILSVPRAAYKGVALATKSSRKAAADWWARPATQTRFTRAARYRPTLGAGDIILPASLQMPSAYAPLIGQASAVGISAVTVSQLLSAPMPQPRSEVQRASQYTPSTSRQRGDRDRLKIAPAVLQTPAQQQSQREKQKQGVIPMYAQVQVPQPMQAQALQPAMAQLQLPQLGQMQRQKQAQQPAQKQKQALKYATVPKMPTPTTISPKQKPKPLTKPKPILPLPDDEKTKRKQKRDRKARGDMGWHIRNPLITLESFMDNAPATKPSGSPPTMKTPPGF